MVFVFETSFCAAAIAGLYQVNRPPTPRQSNAWFPAEVSPVP
jgi:hypothetical protein